MTGPPRGAAPPVARTPPALLALALALALQAAGCARPAAPEPAPRPPPRVVVVTATGASHEVAVELARTDAERERGLMYRRALADGQGMLFLFAESERRAFWMKNTLVPLDMIFIDDGGRVVGVVADAEPLTLSPRDPGVASRYVLEVPAGWSARRGVGPGARVRFENVPP